ncbi:MAG: hypothetical protein ACREOG_00025, partial [Gemmatimonadaceae bacterium]
PHYYAVTNARRGGVTAIFDRSGERLLYEDSGLVIEAAGGTWSSATPAEVAKFSADPVRRTVESTVVGGRAGNAQLTPGKFLILRALGLTAFRSLALGSVLRRMIIARLITGRERGPCTCERSVRFESDCVTITDRMIVSSRRGIRAVRLTRGFQPFHMGSARYFHERDLVEMPVVDRQTAGHWTSETEWSARAVCRWSKSGSFTQETGAAE